MTNINWLVLERLNKEEFPLITFPKEEWIIIKKNLNLGQEISTTRNSCGVNLQIFRVGQKYKTEWEDIIIITKTEHYNDPKKIPTWSQMNDTMKSSILYGIKMCGTKNLTWIHLKKLKS